jgi:hypothetical protein
VGLVCQRVGRLGCQSRGGLDKLVGLGLGREARADCCFWRCCTCLQLAAEGTFCNSDCRGYLHCLQLQPGCLFVVVVERCVQLVLRVLRCHASLIH